MTWEGTSSEKVILSIIFSINFLWPVQGHGHYGYSRDAPSACFSHLPSATSATQTTGARTGLLRHTSGTSKQTAWPLQRRLDFQKTSAPTSGSRLLNLCGIDQLPRKLRAFNVSSLHLAAYVGTGRRWTLSKCLPCETSLQALYITADGVSASFYILSKSDPDIIHYNDSLCSSLRLLCKDTLRRLNSSELLLLLLIDTLHIRVYISSHVGITARHTYSLKPWNFSWKMFQSFSPSP